MDRTEQVQSQEMKDRIMRTYVLICALACSPAAAGSDVRDMHGYLNLRDCAAAESWLADQPGAARKQDAALLLDLAIECAELGEKQTALRLLDAAKPLPAPPSPEWQAHLETRQARALLALGRRDDALALVDAASAHLLAQGGRFWDIESAQTTLYELASQHEAMAVDAADAEQRTALLQRAERLHEASEALVAIETPPTRDFRDLYGELKLPTCGAAQRWLKERPDMLRAGDGTALMSAARRCAVARDGRTAKALLAVSDSVDGPSDWVSMGFSGSLHASVYLALEDWRLASDTLRATSNTLLDAMAQHPDELDRAVGLTGALASKHASVAAALADSDAVVASDHWLLAARLEMLEDGSEIAAAGHRYQALALAMKVPANERALAIADEILAMDIDADSALVAPITRAIGALLARLSDSGRQEDTLGLARKLKATGWPEATRIADALIFHHD